MSKYDKKRCVDTVIGMQYGSEAKGKLISCIAHHYGVMVRTGSINAAHTVYFKGTPIAWHQLPAGSMHMLDHSPDAKVVLGAGAQIDLKYLKREIGWLINAGMVKKGTLAIDARATVIDEFDTFAENGYSSVCGPQWYNPTTCEAHNGNVDKKGNKKDKGTCIGCSLYPKDSLHRILGSTTHGSGMNLVRKISRNGRMIWGKKNVSIDEFFLTITGLHENDVLFTMTDAGRATYKAVRDAYDAYGNNIAEPVPPVRTVADHRNEVIADGIRLGDITYDTVDLLNEQINIEVPTMLEGTQGTMLSVQHGTWPKCTSRDTNAANWFMEAGISPLCSRNVFGVARTYPIRVAGDSGGTSGREMTWKEVSEAAGVKYVHNDDPGKIEGLIEITTATKRVRRVFEFGNEDFKKSMMLNRPNKIMLTFIDYINHDDYTVQSYERLSKKTKDWLLTKESELGVVFNWLSTGPRQEQVIGEFKTGF